MNCQCYPDLWKKANYLQIDQQLIGFCPLFTVLQWIWHSCHKLMFHSDVKRAALGLKVLNNSESAKGLSEIAQSSAALKLVGHGYFASSWLFQKVSRISSPKLNTMAGFVIHPGLGLSP